MWKLDPVGGQCQSISTSKYQVKLISQTLVFLLGSWSGETEEVGRQRPQQIPM